MAQNKKTIYYKDELNDDFSNSKIETVTIDKNYKYIRRSLLWKICSFIVYRMVFSIPAYIYTKVKLGLKVENKEVLKKHKKVGYFIYANHTQEIADTFFPTIANFPKRIYIIAHPNNVSIKYMKTLNKMLGALPVPGDLDSSKNFLEAIQYFIKKKNVIAIYPEAHVWPYYTGIRNFKSVSFKYPVKLDTPVFSCTTTYQKHKNKVRTILYIDGPFYPDKRLNLKQAQEKLRNEVYQKMVARSKMSNIEVIKYIKEEQKIKSKI